MPGSSLARDHIAIALDLNNAARNKPKQAYLRRAVSTTYYALFHCLANCCADCVIGRGPGHGRAAWKQVYRALQHGIAKKACNPKNESQKFILQKFPGEIQDFANQFYAMQDKRHNADYDPFLKLIKSEVGYDVATARSVISGFESAPVADRRAFSALVLFGAPKK